MSRISDPTFLKLENDFLAVTKRVIKKQISKNPEKLKEYERDLKNTYELLIEHAEELWRTAEGDKDIQAVIKNKLLDIRDKLLRSFGKINSRLAITNNLFDKTFEDNSIEFIEGEFEMTEITVEGFLRSAASQINKNYY